ncbi:hypothetical protein ACJMK2_004655 [Sinanodonta woodiana]|uniref:Uncharacterized protein n=1 Tax=Sinanodonta woodiana TaxID=1069815 RepID=A0ABD3Y1Y2_SINWO
MKVQTTVLLLCFLYGVFLSFVVHAKPSPALMKELIALEKYLEKKQGSDGADSQIKNEDDNVLDSFLENPSQNKGNENVGEMDKNKPPKNGQDESMNENSNNAGGEEAPQENGGAISPPKPEEGVPPAKPEEGVPPSKPEEGVPPSKPEEVVPPAKPEEGVQPVKPEEGVTPVKPEESVTPETEEEEGEKPQEGNGESPSEGQVDKERETIDAYLDEASIKNNKVAVILKKLKNLVQTELQEDDLKFNELKTNDEQTKEKAIEQLNSLENGVKDIENNLKTKTTDEKKAVRENAPARRSHLSDAEFLNLVHSLLTNN